MITGEIFVGYFEEDFRENIDHYILLVDINSQTNILKQNLKFILNLGRVFQNCEEKQHRGGVPPASPRGRLSFESKVEPLLRAILY